jgi:predicted Zn-dependent protease
MQQPTHPSSEPCAPTAWGCACAPWRARRGFLLAGSAAAMGLATAPVAAQVQVGGASGLRKLVPAETLEGAATDQYQQLLAKARAQGALAGDNNPQLQRLRAIARRLIPYTAQWNPRANSWRWEVNLIGSKEINAFCMPGGKIAFYTGIIDQLQLTDDEIAMIMGHEMAHALRALARAAGQEPGHQHRHLAGRPIAGPGRPGQCGSPPGRPAAVAEIQPGRRERG